MHYWAENARLGQLLELFRRRLRAGEAHRNDCFDFAKVVLRTVGCLSKTHATTDRQHHIVWFIQILDQSHVAEQVSAAGVVDAAVEMRDADDKSASHASRHQYALWPDNRGWVLCVHHRNLDPAEVEVAARLHLRNEA